MKANIYRKAPVLTLILLALLFSSGSQALTISPPFTQANCADPTLALALASQADVDSFPCTTVAGDLVIGDRANPGAISSLSPGLANLTRVEGILKLDYLSPASLDGLDGVTHLGSLSISNADQLTDISALAGLNSLGPRNCQPGGAACATQMSIISSTITQFPAWNIAGGTALEQLTLRELPLADPTQLDNLPVPTNRLTLDGLPLDTDQPGQLAALNRIAAAAQGNVSLAGMAGVKALPSAPQTEAVELDDLAGIAPAALVSIRDIERITIQNGMPGLSGANPLSGLTGGTFRTLTLTNLVNVGTLADLSAVTSLEGLTLTRLAAFTNLDGLQNLTTLQTLRITDNPNLENLNALRGVTGTLDSVEVVGNSMLTDITGLAGITGVSTRLHV